MNHNIMNRVWRQLKAKKPSFLQLNVVAWLCIYTGAALAADAAPWDGPLCGVANWFRGTTPIAIGSIAFAAAAGGFLWGEEFTGIMKKVVNIVMAIAIMIGGASFVGWIAVKMGAGASACSV